MALNPGSDDRRLGFSQSRTADVYARATRIGAVKLKPGNKPGMAMNTVPKVSPLPSDIHSLRRFFSGSRRMPLRHAAIPKYIKPRVRGRMATNRGTISDHDSCQRNLRIERKPPFEYTSRACPISWAASLPEGANGKPRETTSGKIIAAEPIET